MRKNKIPTFLGIILLVFGLAAGILLVQNKQIFRLGATPQTSPKDIRITNITDSSFTVSWATDKETGGFILWGETENSLTKTELNEISEISETHSVTAQGLSPDRTYFFKISSDGTTFDNNGVPWQITTGPELFGQTISNSISGTILTATGTPAEKAIVYITLAGASPLSTTTSQNGSWVIPISSARNQNLSSFIEINETTTLIEISVQAGSRGVATAQIYPASAKPTPPIILGESLDFKNEPASEIGGIPKANVNLPDDATESSKFEITDDDTTGLSTEKVTLESHEEGEIVTSTEPEFFGEGPPGTTITITVESNPVTDQTTISSSGDWSWSPPEGLSEGVHKITITWRDATGILTTLTRTFVVQAAEGPAFESTPSATPTSSPIPTISPSPTASATPTATPTSTASGIPDSGSLKPTILYSIMGLGLIVFSLTLGFFTFRKT
ncbi:fibronectin type III domain-containing protein [Patescibacteria group bacterium]|nr:fibronectin type III domain-containing protein [Patescibacteria group bacterium]MBU0776753.1 fibronectin type III domain-containing protein [Patescibacteria group bacterium]MBU0846326.1 fibronectin type III domain-containing protein [Patescibacteria group bacterium]MBU0922714.1 fibronectin type III domain-containing protein [Patescibacteria group bacterium]MBU1066765.1 fibronectin type III domain-containing protein [Patescibacteria group bacterium]